MNNAREELLKYMKKAYTDDEDQLKDFLVMISKIFSHIQPAVPGIEKIVLSTLQSDKSISFSMGVQIYDKCLTLGKASLSTLHVPPPGPFIISPPPQKNPTQEDVATHIASLLSLWVSTGLTPVASPASPLILK